MTWSDFILARQKLVLAIGISNMLVGIALGIYTGILLGTLGARPLWNSALLGPLFLFSGLSTAAAVLHGILVLTTPDEERPAFADFLLSSLARLVEARPLDKKVGPVLAGADNSFLTIELGLLCLFLIGLTEFHRRPPTGGRPSSHWVVRGGVLGPCCRNGDPASARAPDA